MRPRRPAVARAERGCAYWANVLLECPDHAAGRFLQWVPNGDLKAALFAAAANFTAADAHEVQAHLPRTDGRAVDRSIYLPSGPGAFVANVINGKVKGNGGRVLFARARTWLLADKLEGRPLAKAASAGRSVACMLLAIARAGASAPVTMTAAIAEATACWGC